MVISSHSVRRISLFYFIFFYDVHCLLKVVATEFFAKLTKEEKQKFGADLTPNSLRKAKSHSTLHKIKVELNMCH